MRALLLGLLIALFLFGLARNGLAVPSRIPTYYTTVVPIDLKDFLKSNNWYIRNFPKRLQGIADNEVFNAFQRLDEVRQIHLWPPTKKNEVKIAEFYENIAKVGSDFLKEFCLGHQINVLIAFELEDSLETLNPKDIDIIVHLIHLYDHEGTVQVLERSATLYEIDAANTLETYGKFSDVLAKMFEMHK